MTEETGIDPTALLAMGMHAHPGTYALMIGSGVSTGAGLPTGWQVVRNLVGQLAAATGPADTVEAARRDPEGWWADHAQGELTYSTLLEKIAPTPAARHSLLAALFTPTDEELDQGLKQPTAAHHAIAELVRSGSVRVIVTTNFDHLLENALETVGVLPQVISRPAQIAGMTPLVHARATIIKANGDYADLDKRNTATELAQYPKEWVELLARVFDEHGLLISGWSGEHDNALVAVIERASARRYPLYWDARSSQNSDIARRLIPTRQGTRIPSNVADDLFPAIVESIQSLRDLARPPLTTSMSVAALKRWLPDPRKRVEMEDLVRAAASECTKATSPVATMPEARPGETAYDGLLRGHLGSAMHVASLLAVGVYYDRALEHADLWTESLSELLLAPTSVFGSIHQLAVDSRHYPAALALRCMGVIAVRRNNDEFLSRLLETKFTEPQHPERHAEAMYWLHDNIVLGREAVNDMSRWNGIRPRYPMSALLRADTVAVLSPYFSTSPVDVRDAQDDYEYRLGLIQFVNPTMTRRQGFATGLFMGDHAWLRNREELPVERRFRERLRAAPNTWPQHADLNDGGEDRLEYYSEALQEAATRSRRL